MGLFSKKHDGEVLERFDAILLQASSMTESEFLDSMNIIVCAVERDSTYKTNEKLKIYELISKISNCLPTERKSYAKKLRKALR